MEPISENYNGLRCRLCFHTGTNAQLIEVFNKSNDLSKRVISALGVKINRSEKLARICTVCETLIDIIQSFQAVCKQTNQLHHSHADFLLYDVFWDNEEQDAVRVTEKMILTHRSEVDKILGKATIAPLKTELGAIPQIITSPAESSIVAVAAREEPLIDIPPITEIVFTDPAIKNEPHCDSEIKIQSESEDMITSENESDVHSEIDNIFPENEKKKVSMRKVRKSIEPIDDDQSASEYEPKIPGKRGPRRKKIRKSDPSVCDICGQTVAHFIKESHHNQHLGVRPYKCDHEGCGRTYYSQNDLRTHSKRHQITYHVCEICGRNIKGVEWFRRHVKTHTEGPQFTCEVCGSKFRRKAQLQTHMVTHTGLTPHECEICGKRFALKYNLEAHVKRHKKKETPGQEAQTVQKDASEKRTWKNYVRSENSDTKHHVTCETCGKSIHKREIEGHVNKHMDRRPYSCDFPGCTLAFYGLRGIKEHKMVVHSDKVLRYDCSICNRSIKGAGTFKRHVMMHNSDMKVECQHCGKKFTSKSYLKAHEQKHSGERPYVCDLCGRSFAMKPCWKMHMKTVHNEDHREPTRVRKRQTENLSDPPKIVDSERPNEKSTSAATVSLETQSVHDQQYPCQQPLTEPQLKELPVTLRVPLIVTHISNYQTPETVREDYSF
ncbi:zinc finger protein 57-like isoform X2 [Armigeres subalbatus]|uniref:zinc finger protein 57-like isoform X2 n=1 Tax=Armigeres subalbatus TaxID=124917 RepID=UPI002ED686D4